jgi:hypothetical protein
MGEIKMNPEQAKIEWMEKVFKKGSVVDPSDEFCWKSLAVGFFLGKGFSIEEARELSREVDY